MMFKVIEHIHGSDKDITWSKQFTLEEAMQLCKKHNDWKKYSGAEFDYMYYVPIKES